MAFKINLNDKSGKTYKLEAEGQGLIDKKLHEVVEGTLIAPELEGYEFEITGASDKSGFTSMANVEGIGTKKVLLTYGKAMKQRPKREGKKAYANKTPKGLRLRKTVRGNMISEAIRQINFKVVKAGSKTLEEIYNPKTEEAPAEEAQ